MVCETYHINTLLFISVPLFRSLSDVQECAQLLAGESMPQAILQGLLSKSKLDGSAAVLAVLNLTPYDACMEKFLKKGFTYDNRKIGFKSLSVTKNLTVAQYVERAVAIDLMEEKWHVYNPNPNNMKSTGTS